ncbi:hypothetical protein L0U85_01360 [Glycomyces sp. L485]|uniref:hypothetical protein n=1 Tax=Glycomyces sp. L485 TaxID=2909235 RepID=UPI001F4BA0A6|nr:hypothetical protein [Glycomyces sp. L485]MCH7229515.1 hypothetical protein [Glycomyces sp. L485]
MTSEQGNASDKGETPEARAPENSASVEDGTTQESAPEPGGAPEAAESQASESAPAESEAAPADPGANGAPETAEASAGDAAEAAETAAPEPETPSSETVDEGATQAIPVSGSIDIAIPAAPAADTAAPEQVPPAPPEPPAPAAPGAEAPAEPAPEPSPERFEDGGTTVLRYSAPQAGSKEPEPSPAKNVEDEATEVLPAQGVGFNPPAPFGEQPQHQSPAQSQQPHAAWPSPPPNPLNTVMPPADAGLPPSGQPPQPPAGQQPPPPQSDDTQRLIIGAQSPQSEPRGPVAPGYGAAQPMPSEQQQMQQPGMYPGSAPGAYPGQMPPGSVPPGGGMAPPPGPMGPGGQYPQQPPPAKTRKKWLVPVFALIAVVVIGAAAVAAILLLRPPSFEEGGCVRHGGGDTAEAIDCEEAVEGEDYQITSKVGDGSECADTGRETLTAGEDVYCLTLLGAEVDGDAEEEAPEGE